MKAQEIEFQKAKDLFSVWLLSEVDRLAKSVVQTHPWAESFCMAMGSASFHCVWQESDEDDPSDTWERNEHLLPDELSGSCAAELDKLLEKWNDEFCLTGYPMRIIKDSVTGEPTTLKDW